MISATEAKNIIDNAVQHLKPVVMPLAECWGKTLEQDVIASMDIPAFPQSSMDGYAFSFRELQNDRRFSVAGESAAGNSKAFRIAANTAARIFTGAAVPEGADTVVMQEKVLVENGMITVNDQNLLQGSNVRMKGSEVKKGEVALEKGNKLTAAALGHLAGIGIDRVSVFPFPKISVIVTGNELAAPGTTLQFGEVFESNSFALTGALKQFHQQPARIESAVDDPDLLKMLLQHVLDESDMVLLTGGVSVGDYDFVIEAATECGVQTLFHKVKLRPGKPLYFGMKGHQVVFGLPGNPSSVLTCFYEYVLRAMGKMSSTDVKLPVLQAPLSAGFSKNIPFTQYLKGYYDGSVVMPLLHQESYKMKSFARANCLIMLNEEDQEVREGDVREIHLIG